MNSARASTALVTGGASGIGQATAVTLARAGFHVIVADRHNPTDTLEHLAATGRPGEACLLDVADVDALKGTAGALLTRHGVIDAIVACAGISGHGKAFADVTVADFDAMMDVHVRGHFFLLQALVPAMVRAGRGDIVLMSSIYARVGAPAMAHYAAAKGALSALTKTLAVELGPGGIRVNAVTPGLVATPMTAISAGSRADFFSARAAEVPLRRLATTEDIAACVAFLLSPAAATLTGQTISPSGGELMVD
jgi:NAD(P)-dependent dehydrogenase (short-subunit alcohol dehydrogenase family)